MKKEAIGERILREVSSYIAGSAAADLPPEVVRRAKHHILDTLAAMVSGSHLKPGELAKKFVRAQRGTKEAQVAGSSLVTTAVNAAFANGVMGHADETDDAHAGSQTHPGCAIVPAALAMAEREKADGLSFLKAVVTGYEIACRITQALWGPHPRQVSHSTHSIGASFGAAAAAAAAARLKEDSVPYVLSYAAQQASGVRYWMRDEEHIEKAFVFGGMPARDGVTSALLIQSGFTGVNNPFEGKDNFFEAFAPDPRPELLTKELGRQYEIMHTTIKKYSAGLPAQAPLEALFLLMQKHDLGPQNVKTVSARLYVSGARVVNNRKMPDINLQHLLAVSLLDGRLTFESAHSYERMKDPEVLKVKEGITLIEDNEIPPLQSIVEITTQDGTQFRERVIQMSGTPENPMSTEELKEKCRDLMAPILGEERSARLMERVGNLEKVSNILEIRPFLGDGIF